jgi:hypothetical protein
VLPLAALWALDGPESPSLEQRAPADPVAASSAQPGVAPAVSKSPLGIVTDRFIRLQRDEQGEVVALQTAVMRLGRDADASVVDLIGAVHVGEKAYYESLNRRFREYDAVLYELVAPEDVRPQPGRRSAHPVSLMQVGMKNLLGLHFQLDCVDYAAENLVHADLSPEEFAASMTERGESLGQMFFRMMGQSLALQAKDPTGTSDARLLAAFFSPERGSQLKRIMAEQFEDSLAVPSVLDGPEGSTLITVRNRRAVDVLAKQLAAGKKTIGIFYGAAHLPDLEAQLKDRLQLLPQQTSWLTAWSME